MHGTYVTNHCMYTNLCQSQLSSNNRRRDTWDEDDDDDLIAFSQKEFSRPHTPRSNCKKPPPQRPQHTRPRVNAVSM